jgi:hypothetical protein
VSGRTSWWSKDAAWHRRERIVELGEEFGSAGPMVIDVLSCWAQEQKSSEGRVRGGYRTLAREAFCEPDEARKIVQFAGEISALDDLAVDPDGRLFECRVSGWSADQVRGKASWRQQEKRNRDREPDPQQGALVTPDDSTSQEVPHQTRPDQTKEQREKGSIPKITYDGQRVSGETVLDALQLLAVFNSATERDLGAWTATKKPSPALRQIIGGLLSRPEVEAVRWANAIRNTVSNPPDFAKGRSLQLGDVFGTRAADHALTNPGRPGACPASPPKCRDCAIEISEFNRMNRSSRCDPCYDSWQTRHLGAAA